MTTRTDQQTDLGVPVREDAAEDDDAAFWARAASYGFVRPERIPPDQLGFWTREWIEGEIEASEDIAAGRGTRYYSDEEFLAALRQAARDADLRS